MNIAFMVYYLHLCVTVMYYSKTLFIASVECKFRRNTSLLGCLQLKLPSVHLYNEMTLLNSCVFPICFRPVMKTKVVVFNECGSVLLLHLTPKNENYVIICEFSCEFRHVWNTKENIVRKSQWGPMFVRVLQKKAIQV